MTYPNWFAQYAQGYFEKHLAPFAGREGLRFLQIGAFTGDASVWLLENVLTGKGSFLVDVDTWEGSDEPEHEAFDWRDVERTYDEKTEPFQPARLVKYKGASERFLAASMSAEYDFVYIDGDHAAIAVIDDAIGAYRLLKPGGLLAFDDYLWKPSNGGGESLAPGVAIDTFLAGYSHSIQVLDKGHQVWARKLA